MTDTQTPTPVADALAEVNRVQANRPADLPVSYIVASELHALRDLADAVRSHGIGVELGQLRRAALTAERPMGWLAQELAEGTTPAVIRAHKHNARSERTRYRELVLVDPHDGEPARLVVTDTYSGHSEAYDLPEGVRLAVPPF